MGGKIDKVMTKFNENDLKLRRAFSLEAINEEESWYIPSDEDENKQQAYTKIPKVEEFDNDEARPRRYSFPLTPRTR